MISEQSQKLENIYLQKLSNLEELHLAQAINYCQTYILLIGLLISFGAKSLEFKRVYNVNHPDNKGYKRSALGLNRLKDDKILSNKNSRILQSNNPENLNSDN